MSEASPDVARALETAYREEGGRIRATLIGKTRDFDLAEDVLQDAVAAALRTWPKRGVPDSPGAWLLTTAKNRFIDRLRHDQVRRDKEPAFTADEVERLTLEIHDALDPLDAPDERLRLLFTCCHPALPEPARVALTLRTLGGLTTPEIARAFLVPEATLSQRLVRAQRKIKAANIPYRVPPPELLDERLSSVLAVLYLIFNEGYAATTGEDLVRVDLCREAIELARLLDRLLPNTPEVMGLLALMWVTHGRAPGRQDDDGELVVLAEQDRTRWNHDMIARGAELVARALSLGKVGPYQVQAAIGALHGTAKNAADTDWPQIVELYSVLQRLSPTAVVALNRAVAVSMAAGASAGLDVIDELEDDPELARYHYLHVVRADLLERVGDRDGAIAAYDEALRLCQHDAERRHLERKRAALLG